MTTLQRTMIFHTPYPLNRQATSASGIRPVAMRDAFEQLGYRVLGVTGTTAERRQAIKRVRQEMAGGTTVDFCYSESSTMPTAMTGARHLPLHPLLDLGFLASLRRAGVKVGLFYRDIYWRFPEYGQGMNPAKRAAAVAMYHYDLLAYRAATDVVYLPSEKMAPYLRSPQLTTRPLPPGHNDPVVGEGPRTGAHLFYVGGLGSHYRLHKLLEAVHVVADEGREVTLTLCMPQKQWEQQKSGYEHLAHGPVRIVHGFGAALQEHYDAANMAVLFNEPNEIRSFAAPVKLYEYVGQAKPILASEGTLAGQFVAENHLGWTIPYTVDAAADTLRRLADDPDEIARVHRQVLERRDGSSWLSRARTVAEDLSSAPLPA